MDFLTEEELKDLPSEELAKAYVELATECRKLLGIVKSRKNTNTTAAKEFVDKFERYAYRAGIYDANTQYWKIDINDWNKLVYEITGDDRHDVK